MGDLLDGGSFTAAIDEQVVFANLDEDENAVWSLLLAAGDLRIRNTEFDGSTYQYTLALTNKEVWLLLETMITQWFAPAGSANDGFMQAMITGDAEGMNRHGI